MDCTEHVPALVWCNQGTDTCSDIVVAGRIRNMCISTSSFLRVGTYGHDSFICFVSSCLRVFARVRSFVRDDTKRHAAATYPYADRNGDRWVPF